MYYRKVCECHLEDAQKSVKKLKNEKLKTVNRKEQKAITIRKRANNAVLANQSEPNRHNIRMTILTKTQ
jgi:hypothetical protein